MSDQTSPSPSPPKAGKWVIFAAASCACIPLVAIAPATWKMPLGILSMALLVVTVVLLLATEVRERLAAKTKV